MGWPFGRLAPKLTGTQPGIRLQHALLIGLLSGWTSFAVFSHLPEGPDTRKLLLIIPYFAVFFACLFRILVYCDGYMPPISFVGRLATGRLIIPGYDQVFVAPLLIILAGSAFESFSPLLGFNPLFSYSGAIAVVLFISLGVGPSLYVWRLTGHHRITEGSLRTAGVKVG